jgi:hypothetical protein
MSDTFPAVSHTSGSWRPRTARRWAIANHFVGSISYKLARERLLASPEHWIVEDDPEPFEDSHGMMARFRVAETETHSIFLYANHSVDESIKTGSNARVFVFMALEGTLGTTLEDIHGSGSPWWHLDIQMTEAEYEELAAHMREHLGDKWLPNSGYLSLAEIEEIGRRAGEMERASTTPLTSESDYMEWFYFPAREAVEAERAAKK